LTITDYFELGLSKSNILFPRDTETLLILILRQISKPMLSQFPGIFWRQFLRKK